MGSKIPEDSASVSSSSWETGKLDCPVCYTCLIPPIFQCKNGHLICKDCIKKLNVCPVCRASLPRDKIRSLIAEKFVANMSTKCPNTDSGCQLVLKVVELEEHVKNCLFRPLRMCEYFGFHECAEEVALNGIVSHLKSAHQVREVNIQNGHYIELLQTGIPDAEMDRGATLWSPVIFEYDDYPPFVLKTTLTVDSLSWTISAVHSYEQVEELTPKIKLITDKDETASLTWKGRISNCKASFADRNSSFSVPVCTMRGLDHWKLLIMIYRAEEIKPEREILNLTLEPRPAPTFIQNHLRPGKAHPGVNCDRCGERVKGLRFKCSVCPDFDLCQSCYVKKVHMFQAHVFLVLPSPTASAALTEAISLTYWRRAHAWLQDMTCDECIETIKGLWFMCSECVDYNLCQRCFLGRRVHTHHLFVSAQSPVVDNLSRNGALWQGMKLSSAIRSAQLRENDPSSSHSHLPTLPDTSLLSSFHSIFLS